MKMQNVILGTVVVGIAIIVTTAVITTKVIKKKAGDKQTPEHLEESGEVSFYKEKFNIDTEAAEAIASTMDIVMAELEEADRPASRENLIEAIQDEFNIGVNPEDIVDAYIAYCNMD
ncbi:MAG: hypothetical protein K0R00_27 [Herbinix sp.]|jgi:hypothetical protein|nr:hypothetical protein [Herbinix sp.]